MQIQRAELLLETPEKKRMGAINHCPQLSGEEALLTRDFSIEAAMIQRDKIVRRKVQLDREKEWQARGREEKRSFVRSLKYISPLKFNHSQFPAPCVGPLWLVVCEEVFPR